MTRIRGNSKRIWTKSKVGGGNRQVIRCAIGIDDRSGPIKMEAGVIEVRARNKGKRLSRFKAAERNDLTVRRAHGPSSRDSNPFVSSN